MGYKSIDTLQNDLAIQVFHNRQDSKKAAGRALGTLVELVTYYLLCSWDLRDHIVIERKLPEFANSEIVHNVEFSLHPIRSLHKIGMQPYSRPVTPAKIRKQSSLLANHRLKSNQIVTSRDIKRNATLLVDTQASLFVAHVDQLSESSCDLTIVELNSQPFAIFECKRVGVEEGMKKGPQTIEKAKQGAYVARSVSSLQKIRSRNGQIQGIIEEADGNFRMAPYHSMLREVIGSDSLSEFPGFMLTVGIVSNHGNWFTSNNYNKELRVLAQSYDWLLFLTDQGLHEFIERILINPGPELEAAKQAFLDSYSGKAGGNRFTKVNIDVSADESLRSFFQDHSSSIDKWFNVIAPERMSIDALKRDLGTLSSKPS
ncbi:MAG: hypothetical protein OXI34_04750 [Chloroflexota bacterium]|nr:hypothetical protein [Chloroflexota bacterium]MDE2946259.1 hypothetical protein [Chloroflexota bacterium]